MKKLFLSLFALLLPVCMWAQMDESPATAENPIKSSDNQERVYTIFDKYKDVLIVVNAPLEMDAVRTRISVTACSTSRHRHVGSERINPNITT